MKKLILIAGLVLLIPLMGFAFEAYSPAGEGRIIQTFQYEGGLLATTYNPDDDSYSVFAGGHVTKSYFADSPNDPFYVATYENGRIVSSVNQYGDVTTYDELGRKVQTTHTTQDYDEITGEPVAGTKETNVIAKYNYDEYGRLSSVERKVADTDANGDLTGTYHWETNTYQYRGSQLVTITNGENGNVIHFNASETYTTHGVTGKVISRTVTNADTGRLSTTYYDEKSGAVTGTATYDSHNRLYQTFDMDGNLQMEMAYRGSHIFSQTVYIRYETGDMAQINVTYFDQWGNKMYTKQTKYPPPPPPPAPSGNHEPTVTGELLDVVEIDGVFYAVVDADQIDIFDGNGFQSADGETIYAEIDADTAAELQCSIGDQVLFAGDVAEDADGHLCITMNTSYGGGYAVGEENVDSYIENRGDQAWYQDLVVAMDAVWADVTAQFGEHSDWRQGFELLRDFVFGG